MTEDDPNVYKILGITYDGQLDSFTYNVRPRSIVPTKRSVLSHIATIIDLLGCIAPTVFCTKQFMQEIWKTTLNWDNNLPEDLRGAWTAFVTQIPLLSKLNIPRLIFPRKQTLTHCRWLL